MARQEIQPLRLKTVAVGFGAAGKTCMAIRYATGQFPENYIPIVFDKFVADAEFHDLTVKLELWDTGGEKDYSRLRPLNYPNTDVFLLLFDITVLSRFEEIYSYWWKELNHHCPNVPIILVGSKIDLRVEGITTITTVQGKAMAKKIGAAKYMEISSLKNWGVTELFQKAISIGHRYKTVVRKKKKHKCDIL